MDVVNCIGLSIMFSQGIITFGSTIDSRIIDFLDPTFLKSLAGWRVFLKIIQTSLNSGQIIMLQYKGKIWKFPAKEGLVHVWTEIRIFARSLWNSPHQVGTVLSMDAKIALQLWQQNKMTSVARHSVTFYLVFVAIFSLILFYQKSVCGKILLRYSKIHEYLVN